MKRSYKRWTNEEEQVIISMRAEGYSIKEIAKAINRKPKDVQNKVCKLINECKVSKKGSIPKKLDYDRIVEVISKYPGNLREAFRVYAKEANCSARSVANAYYDSKYSNGNRIKDRGTIFTIVSKEGHTINNSKITNTIQKSNLWNRIKNWIIKSLLS